MSSAGPTLDVERPVVVCGVGRSGTSLLMAMLDAHPALAFPPETRFFRRYVARAGRRRRHEAAGPTAFAARLAGDAEFARAGVSAAAVLEGERPGDFDLARAYRRFLGLVAERAGKPRVGDKDPRSLEHLPALARCLPGAFVLHVVRDPRDVVLSRSKAAWSAERPWWAHALIVREQLRRGRALGARFGARWLEVRYEELLAAPADVLRAVCAHCELPFAEGMLDFGGSAAGLVDAAELPWKREVLGPLLVGNAGKWRAELTPFQVRWIEAVCRESFAREYGRERPAPVLAAGQRFALGAAPLARSAAALAYGLHGLLGGRAA